MRRPSGKTDALERAGLEWYLPGPEALFAYASPRQTMDVDLVVAADAGQLTTLVEALAPGHYVSEPAVFGMRTMASV